MFRRLLNWLTGKPTPPDDYDAEKDEAWYNEKSAFLERTLGPEHDMVMHAIIPFAVGGGLDLYYFPHGGAGTAIATKELADARGDGPSNLNHRCYELVMFTKHALNLEDANNVDTPFGAAHTNINATLNIIASYTNQATLNPHETCEFPKETEQVGGKCFVLDAFTPPQEDLNGLGLLLIMEIHRNEMDYARKHGGAALITLLKDHGYYPCSDLDRPTVA